MSRSSYQRKLNVIDRLTARLGDAPTASPAAYCRSFYEHVPPDDVCERQDDELLAAVTAMYRLAQGRTGHEPLVRVFNPDVEQHGWQSPHTIIQIVNDDMPFLVDSITAELNRRGLAVHLVIHPIVRVVRDDSGTIQTITPAGDGEGEGRVESHMHVEIDELQDPAEMAAVQDAVVAVIQDVRAAVEDWPTMTAKVDEVIASLRDNPPPAEAGDVEEAVAFLQWLCADNFTFLGYRDYDYEGTGENRSMEVVEGSGLGIIRNPDTRLFGRRREMETLPEDVRHFMLAPSLLQVTKANRRSTVHRGVHLDTISLKRFDSAGNVDGEQMFAGLFTSSSYLQRVQQVPMLRAKVRDTLKRSELPPRSHARKALEHILETFPRDELYQIEVDDLERIARGILDLQERQRTALFMREDPFERFVSAFVFCPRERYNTELRHRFGDLLAKALNGRVSAFFPLVNADAPLARVHFIIGTEPGNIPEVDFEDLENQIIDAARDWSDMLRDQLVASLGEERGLTLHRSYSDGLPAGYRERVSPAAAVFDLERVESARSSVSLQLNLYRPIDMPAHAVRLKVYHADRPIPLSDVLPMLEHMGLKVMTEEPYRIQPRDDRAVHIHDFSAEQRGREPIDLETVKARFEDAFVQVWDEQVEDDGFNALVLLAGLSCRDVVVLRALAKYLRQAGIQFSQDYLEQTLARHPWLVNRLVAYFQAKFDPDFGGDRNAALKDLETELEHGLKDVDSLDEDVMLRRFLNLMQAALRTNYFQPDAEGAAKSYVAFKFESAKVDGLPLPRPLYEVFVYAPSVEAVHLRGGKVARGGIRWSDRREDFRTEVLGLMKAQMVKNAVIVPVGSKGGFVVKRPPAPTGDPAADRQAQRDAGIECYKTFMGGLLDITDNLVDGQVVPPNSVVRHDDDDPYLVVAADKGTATFSDIANGVSLDYGFWLGDAFASGGSAGYDHKKMGITARGGWESVKRHFREIGHDTQTQDFTVVGVGDMSGDVFGNGMLLSEHIRLVAAFNHLHIFVDPDPDAAASFKERARLFELPRSSWSDYDESLLSTGGKIFDRSHKSLTLTPEIRACLDIAEETVTPFALMRAILKAQVDLLWFGGIGTYVKAKEESHADAGDKANDAIRINAGDLRCKVIGEGANLGVTQRARIAFGERGGRLNTDAIDNSAGVDCSDHEVNIKILLSHILSGGDMTLKQRDTLLVEMTDEVADLVLQDNYLQTQAISVARHDGMDGLDAQVMLMRDLERSSLLNREIEFLPNDEMLEERRADGVGLTRPELAVLLAYAKIDLYDDLIASDLPDDDGLVADLFRYFPRPLRKRFPDQLTSHALKREIIATFVTNSVINRAGITFINDLKSRYGCNAPDATRAYAITREVYGLRELWADIAALDNQVPADSQLEMLSTLNQVVARATGWFLVNAERPLEIAAHAARYQPGVEAISAALLDVLPEEDASALERATLGYTGQGVGEGLARRIAALGWLSHGIDIVRIAARTAAGADEEGNDAGPDVIDVAATYFAVGQRFGFADLRRAAEDLPIDSSWERRAAGAVIDDLDVMQSALTGAVVAGSDDKGMAAIEAWTDGHDVAVARWDSLIAEVRSAKTPVDLSMLTVARRHLGALLEAA